MLDHFVRLALKGLKPLLTHFGPVLHKDTKLKSMASLQCRRKSRGIHPHRDWDSQQKHGQSQQQLQHLTLNMFKLEN